MSESIDLHAPIRTFQETTALFAVMNDDMDDARRIVTNMPANERETFDLQLKKLREVLREVTYVFCAHCDMRITRVSREYVGENEVWCHAHNKSGYCHEDGPLAAPKKD